MLGSASKSTRGPHVKDSACGSLALTSGAGEVSWQFVGRWSHYYICSSAWARQFLRILRSLYGCYFTSKHHASCSQFFNSSHVIFHLRPKIVVPVPLYNVWMLIFSLYLSRSWIQCNFHLHVWFVFSHVITFRSNFNYEKKIFPSVGWFFSPESANLEWTYSRFFNTKMFLWTRRMHLWQSRRKIFAENPKKNLLKVR